MQMGCGPDRRLYFELVIVKVAVDEGVFRVEAESGLGSGVSGWERGRLPGAGGSVQSGWHFL